MMSNLRLCHDRWFAGTAKILIVLCGLLVFVMVAGLYWRSRLILSEHSWSDLLLGKSWRPLKGEFGFLPFIMGTLWITGLAMLLAVPMSLLTAVYLSEYAPRWVRKSVRPVIDVLAGIPSVVFGVWGLLVIIPWIRDRLAPALGVTSTGYCVLAGGVVLAVMVVPIIIHVVTEVLQTIPFELREASWSLGATQWETIRYVVMRKAMPGIIAAVVLGLSRAFGETMAVMMVAGNVAHSPGSVFDPGYALPALIANNYGEMMSVPFYDSALLLAALLLLGVVLIFNILARVILLRVERAVQ